MADQPTAPLTIDETGRNRWQVWLVPIALGALLAALLMASTVVWLHRDGTIDSGVLVVSQDEARNFFTLDYRDPDKDVDRVLGLATGTFKKQYAAKRKEIVAGVTDKKLVVTASVQDGGAAVEFERGDKAQAIVAVDVTTTTAAGKTEKARYRTRLNLSRIGGTWLVSAVNQVG